MFNNNSKIRRRVEDGIYELSEIPETEDSSKRKIIEKLDKESYVVSEKLRKDMADFHDKMSKKYGDNYRGTSIMCSTLIDGGEGVKSLVSSNFCEHNLETKRESEKVIEALKFCTEKNSEKIQGELNKKLNGEVDRERVEKFAIAVQDVVDFTKDFLGERIYEELDKKGYLDPYGMIDCNNKEALDETRKILAKRTRYEKITFWDCLEHKLKKITDI